MGRPSHPLIRPEFVEPRRCPAQPLGAAGPGDCAFRLGAVVEDGFALGVDVAVGAFGQQLLALLVDLQVEVRSPNPR